MHTPTLVLAHHISRLAHTLNMHTHTHFHTHSRTRTRTHTWDGKRSPMMRMSGPVI